MDEGTSQPSSRLTRSLATARRSINIDLSSSNPSPSNPSIIELMRVIQEQNATLLQLLANCPATAKQYKHPPAYACGILLENSTPEQVSDWLAAIQAGNRLRPTASESHYIEWALTKVTPVLQTQWRNHQFIVDVMGDGDWRSNYGSSALTETDPGAP
ncbi:hypothetical protein LY78DRAFT_698120 [Colletotrichum sublineola]|nr:hypothetical protein LY78DRAFT_698120 [Colletotrichum sublineola]